MVEGGFAMKPQVIGYKRGLSFHLDWKNALNKKKDDKLHIFFGVTNLRIKRLFFLNVNLCFIMKRQ
jgi:hypothetical protein